MGFRKAGSGEAVAAPAVEAAPAAAEPEAAAPAAEAEAAPAAPESGGIVSPRMRAAAAAAATAKPAAGQAAARTRAAPVGDALEDWTHSGDEAAAIAEAQVAEREAAREERRARGYWPRAFRLIPPGTPSRNGPINDQFQKDIIVLDAKLGPAFWLHRLKNPRNGRFDVYEPCPKEYDNCPLDPPTGQYDSRYVALLSVLNINGYVRGQNSANPGEFVPMTQELLIVESAEQAFFHAQLREHGTLRGLQLTMKRMSKTEPDIGIPTDPRWHDEAAIEKFIKDNGMWREKRTRPSTEHPEGEKIGEEDWLMHPFVYGEFLHKPTGADLRERYGNSGQAPLGAQGGGDNSEWGRSRYEPGTAGPPNGAGWGGAPLGDADLDDDVPF